MTRELDHGSPRARIRHFHGPITDVVCENVASFTRGGKTHNNCKILCKKVECCSYFCALTITSAIISNDDDNWPFMIVTLVIIFRRERLYKIHSKPFEYGDYFNFREWTEINGEADRTSWFWKCRITVPRLPFVFFHFIHFVVTLSQLRSLITLSC